MKSIAARDAKTGFGLLIDLARAEAFADGGYPLESDLKRNRNVVRKTSILKQQ